jgi:hypothetical protein
MTNAQPFPLFLFFKKNVTGFFYYFFGKRVEKNPKGIILGLSYMEMLSLLIVTTNERERKKDR